MEEWRLLIEEQKESGLKQKEFCILKGISLKTFSARKSNMNSNIEDQSKINKPKFIKVKSEEDIKIPRTIIINQVSVPNLQIRTRSGIAIEFPISALKPVMNILNGVEQW
jgi:hypothetical protein